MTLADTLARDGYVLRRRILSGNDIESRYAGRVSSAFAADEGMSHEESHGISQIGRETKPHTAKPPLPMRQCACGCGLFQPRRKDQKFATHACKCRQARRNYILKLQAEVEAHGGEIQLGNGWKIVRTSSEQAA